MNKPKRSSRWGSKQAAGGADAVQADAIDTRTVIGATVLSVEAHLRRALMYKLTLRLEFEPGEEDTDLMGYADADVPEPYGDWHDEVDALIMSAQTAAEPGEAVLTIHEDTLVGWRLLKGRKLTGAEYSQLREEERKEEAYRDALAMLERKARTTVELSRALKRKGYSAEAVAGAVERLRASRFVDDAAFARRFAEQRSANQKKGKLLIRQELQQRGVGRPEIDRAIEGIEPEVEREAALALARKKWPTTKGTDRERQMKVMAMLMRRGYTGSIVKDAVRQAASEAGSGRSEDEDWSDYEESLD